MNMVDALARDCIGSLGFSDNDSAVFRSNCAFHHSSRILLLLTAHTRFSASFIHTFISDLVSVSRFVAKRRGG